MLQCDQSATSHAAITNEYSLQEHIWIFHLQDTPVLYCFFDNLTIFTAHSCHSAALTICILDPVSFPPSRQGSRVHWLGYPQQLFFSVVLWSSSHVLGQFGRLFGHKIKNLAKNQKIGVPVANKIQI